MGPSQDQYETALEAYLLGEIELDRCVALQQRLVDAARVRLESRVDLLLCEHPRIITVGRSGSPGDLPYAASPVRNGQIDIRWIRRGGGSLVHTPGQLAVYPIVRLADHGWSVGQFMERFQSGIARALEAVRIHCHDRPPEQGLWGRTGKLVSFGAAVSQGVTWHGAFLNVCPAMGMLRLIDPPSGDVRHGTLVAERGQPVKMTLVRAELIRHLAEAFGCTRQHLHTGHPWLRRPRALVH